MLAELTEKAIRTIRDAARRLTGAARREFEAGVAIDYCQGSPRRAETVFGWGRATVQAGLDQWQTGVGRQDQFFQRGRRKTEEKIPNLEKHIRPMVRLLENVYSKGVRLCRQAIQPYADRLRRLPSLLKWSVEVFPLIAPPV